MQKKNGLMGCLAIQYISNLDWNKLRTRVISDIRKKRRM